MDGSIAENKNASLEKQRPLVQQAYEQIREKIIQLQFLPGQFLNEAAICKTLEMGRTPVHQALQLLQLEGLIEILPRKGVIVQPDGANEILKILEARMTIEPELARMAALRAGRGELSTGDMSELLELAKETDPDIDPPDIDLFVTNDRRFHRKIGDLAENSIMSDFAKTLHERSCRFWYLNLWQTLNVELSRGMHIDIAQSIVSGEADAAASAMRAHIENLSNRLKRLPPNAFGMGQGQPVPR